ncbi:MAG: hypothetical protein Q9161_004996 [Pseudevernia consocians]
MSSLISGAVSGLITGVSGLVSGNANDQNFRNGWTQQQIGTVTAANPKKNVIIVFPPHDQNLQDLSGHPHPETQKPKSISQNSSTHYIMTPDN